MGQKHTGGRNARLRRMPRIEALEGRAMLSLASPTLASPTTAGTVTPPYGATNYDAIIGATAARSAYGVTGQGLTVATIDTGVNYTNEDLGGGLGAGDKVVAGYDFADGTANPIAVDQHGTAVAGLIAGSDPASPGVAPGADIVALRVFNNSGQSSFDEVASALQWVVANHAKYNISVVNMSISDGGNYSQNWYNSGGSGGEVTGLIAELDALNIPVVAATGNNFNGTQGEGFTAIAQDVISVTATDANDKLASNAQRLGTALGGSSATTLAAPGVNLYAPIDGNNFGVASGTSFAAPLVSGSIVLLQQIYEQRFGTLPTVSQVQSWLQKGAVTVHDPLTGIDIGRLDVPSSASLVPSPVPSPTPPPTPAPAPTPNPLVASSPVVTPTPAPVVTPTPAPVVTPTPAPVVTPPPAPVVTPTPAPAPVVTPPPAPAPVVTPTPAPVVTPTPAPVIAPTPTPIVAPTPGPTIVATTPAATTTAVAVPGASVATSPVATAVATAADLGSVTAAPTAVRVSFDGTTVAPLAAAAVTAPTPQGAVVAPASTASHPFATAARHLLSAHRAWFSWFAGAHRSR